MRNHDPYSDYRSRCGTYSIRYREPRFGLAPGTKGNPHRLPETSSAARNRDASVHRSAGDSGCRSPRLSLIGRDRQFHPIFEDAGQFSTPCRVNSVPPIPHIVLRFDEFSMVCKGRVWIKSSTLPNLCKYRERVRCTGMYSFFLFAMRTGLFAEGRFMGKVLDEWASDAQEFIHIKLPHLIMVFLVGFVLSRLLSLVTHNMIRLAERHAAGAMRVAQVRTLAGVVRTTGLSVIGAIVGLQFLGAIGVNLEPLLASAGIAGVAIGLAAQNIVKDMLNGSLILIEDQFNVGDVVTVAGLTGTVEAMTLRKTTVRGGDGTLYVVPNSQITTVANQSADFSVATVNVSVDFSADPNRVLDLLQSIASDVRNSPDFKDLFLAEPQILGVDAMKGSQLIFPVVFKTKAQKQFGPIREFQRRVRMALEEHHLLPGDPMRVFNSFSGKDDGAHSGTGTMMLEHEAPPPRDPTTIKPQESNPFTGE